MNNYIWCFWMGGRLSLNRKECIKSLINNSGCQVNLVTDKNIYKYEIKDDPIHSSFQYLSAIHKSAILRSYFMYHYGGGYADLKRYDFSWTPYFNYLNNSSYQFIGYYEKTRDAVANQCSDKAKDSWNEMVGNGCFIFKEKTEFAKIWLNRTKLLLDQKYSLLKNNPGWYHPRAIPGGIQGLSNEEFNIFNHPDKTLNYPIGWGEPMGAIFQQLQYEYKKIRKENVFVGGIPHININNYQ